MRRNFARHKARDLALFYADWACNGIELPAQAADVRAWLLAGPKQEQFNDFKFTRDRAFKLLVQKRVREIIGVVRTDWPLSIDVSLVLCSVAEQGQCSEAEFFDRFAVVADERGRWQPYTSARARHEQNPVLHDIREYTTSIKDHMRYIRACRALDPTPELKTCIRQARRAKRELRERRQKLARAQRGTAWEADVSEWM